MLAWILVETVVGFDRPTILPNLGTAEAVLMLASRPSVRAGVRGDETS